MRRDGVWWGFRISLYYFYLNINLVDWYWQGQNPDELILTYDQRIDLKNARSRGYTQRDL